MEEISQIPELNNPAAHPPARGGLLRSIGWNYFGYACDIVAGIVLLGYILHRIAPAEYGLLALGNATVGFFFLFDLGLYNVLVQAFVAKIEKDDRNGFEGLLSTVLILLGVLGSVGLVAFYGLSHLLPGPFNIPSQYVATTRAIFLLIGLSFQIGMPTTALAQTYEAFQRFDRLNQIRFATSVARIVFTVLVLSCGGGIIGLAGVQVAVDALRFLLLWLSLPSVGQRLWIRPRFEWTAFRSLLHFGGWAWAENICRQAATFSDTAILGVFRSMDSVALFGVGNKLPTHVSTVVTRGAIALLPEFARQNASQATLRRLYSTSLSLIIGGVLPVVVLGGVCAQPILQVWAGTPYLQAGTVMQWLLVAAFSFAIEHPSDLLLYGQGQVKVAGRMAIAESIANVVVSLVLASRYGAVGLAAGTAITHVIINVFWYTPTACRVLELSPLDLLKSSRQGLGWPVVLLLAEAIAMHSLVASGASAVTCVAVGVLLGLIYLLTWGFEVLLPLYRSGAEGMLHSSLLAHGGAVTE